MFRSSFKAMVVFTVIKIPSFQSPEKVTQIQQCGHVCFIHDTKQTQLVWTGYAAPKCD